MTPGTTRRAPRIRSAAIAVVLVLLTLPMGAQKEGPYTTSFGIDWESRLMTLTVTLSAAAPEYQPPGGRARIEAMIERDLPTIVKAYLFGIPVDSYRTVESTVLDGTIDANAILSLIAAGRRESSLYSKDLRSFEARYSFDLNRCAELYVRHRTPSEPASLMDFGPSKAYTGVVIYAKGSLPVHGEFQDATLRPCLFPRIFDEDMNLLLERNYVAADAISKWGICGYSGAADRAAMESRVGGEPLQILALEVFGSLRTDLVITKDDALRLLSKPENLRLITEGRFVIVCDLP